MASAVLAGLKMWAQMTQKCQSIWILQNSLKSNTTQAWPACEIINTRNGVFYCQYSFTFHICKVCVVLLCPVNSVLACPVCLSRGVIIQPQTFRRFIRKMQQNRVIVKYLVRRWAADSTNPNSLWLSDNILTRSSYKYFEKVFSIVHHVLENAWTGD